MAGKDKERIQIEDSLKHLYQCAQEGQTGTLESLAGILTTTREEAGSALMKLQAAGLVRLEEGSWQLTGEGREYALRIIRAHRLYETYLAQETGLQEPAWHHQAEIHEHRLTPSQVDDLAQRLGHPPFDPHGDPIPTAEGVVPTVAGQLLSQWPVGELARVVHVEDEPDLVYAQLVALGLCPGIDLCVTESSAKRIVIEIEGERHVLAPLVAAGITVVAAPESAEPGRGKTVALAALRLGERARVVGISPRCRGAERRRLMDLGIVPRTIIQAELRSPVGDPTGYRVRDTLVALRREQAELISVVRLQKGGP